MLPMLPVPALPVTRPVRLLWTGGWDSTFRLLFLLLVDKRPVEPHYVVTIDRPSIGTELRTMARLKEALFNKFPECRALLRPSRLFDVTDLAPNARTTAQIKALKAVDYIGRQYEHLARYAEHFGLNELELSIERDSRPYLFLREAVRRVESSDGYANWALVDVPHDANLELFRAFRFPLFELTKLDMQRVAAEHGFSALMEQTWFCHKPLRGGVPCGRCGPCGCAMTEGMARRLPWTSRLRYRARQARKRLGRAR
jgi:hypothetical protein